MKKELIKIVSLVFCTMISLMIIIYVNFNITPLTNTLIYVLGSLGALSQILIMMIIYRDFNNIIKKSIVMGLIFCELICAVMCIINDNNLLGTSLIILFFAIIYTYPKIKSLFTIIEKKRNLKKLLNYIEENYPDAEISKRDNDIKSFNGRSVKFYLGDDIKKKSYRVFIDSEGIITDMFKVFKENNIDIE